MARKDIHQGRNTGRRTSAPQSAPARRKPAKPPVDTPEHDGQGRRRQRPATDIWDAKAPRRNKDQIEEFRTGMRILSRRAKTPHLILGLAVAAGLIGAIMGSNASSMVDSLGDTHPTSVSILSDAGRIQARSAAESWLPGVLGKGSRIISWDGSVKGDTKEGTRIHRFTVTDAKNRWYRLEITIDTQGRLAGQPSLTSLDGQAGQGGQAEWAGVLGSLTPSTALTARLTGWASALAGSDPDALMAQVADDDPDAAYNPLGLDGKWKATVETAAYLDRGKVDRQDRTGEWAVARVTLTSEKSDAGSTMTYDVLIHNPDDATPGISAWGAPGSGPNLQPGDSRGSQAVNDRLNSDQTAKQGA